MSRNLLNRCCHFAYGVRAMWPKYVRHAKMQYLCKLLQRAWPLSLFWIQTRKRFRKCYLFGQKQSEYFQGNLYHNIKLQNDTWQLNGKKCWKIKWKAESHLFLVERCFLSNAWKNVGMQKLNRQKRVSCHANILPSTGQENNVAQPKPDKWWSFSSNFSSFFTVQQLLNPFAARAFWAIPVWQETN